MMKNRLCVLLASFAFLGCIGIRQYRPAPVLDPPCQVTDDDSCATHSYFLLSESPEVPPNIPVAIIEFDDQGSLHDRALKDAVMARVKAVAEDGGALVVVYAHGWDNNASAGSGALRNFQGALREVAKRDADVCKQAKCKNRKVVGVYLAWRGKSIRSRLVHLLTFWGRKARAHRIGQDGATEVLAELAKTVSDARRDKPEGRKWVDRLIVVGHSFGGALIYDATQQLLMKDLVSQKSKEDERPGAAARKLKRGWEPRSQKVPTTVGDLVILVNPAFEAARLTPLWDRAATMEFRSDQQPILAVFTSRRDLPNRRFFPVGRTLATLLKSYNPARRHQARLDRTAAGHYAGYQTHDLDLKPGPTQLASLEASVCAWESFSRRETSIWDVGTMVLARRSEQQRITPYYNILVDADIVRGHHQIWDSADFRDFISVLVSVQAGGSCDFYQRR